MTIYERLKSEKIWYHFDGEATKISALSSGYIDKFE